MNNEFTYWQPTKIQFTHNWLTALIPLVKNRRVLLVTSKGFVTRGIVETITSNIPSVSYVCDNIVSHPELKDLQKAYKDAHVYKYDCIIAIGGGSVLDAAKFLSVIISNAEGKSAIDSVTRLVKDSTSVSGYATLPIIAIPTTSGTGSEVTPWATIWDSEIKKKYSLHLPTLFSEAAIYDPNLTISLPIDITRQTALDTLSHALESIWNKHATPITVQHAITAAQLVYRHLPSLLCEPTNLALREQIMLATMHAGMAFSQTQTAMAHALSYYITANKGIPHGIACSFTLPMLIDEVIGQYDFVDNALKAIFTELSSDPLREMYKSIGLLTEFSDYGLSDSEVVNLIESVNNQPRAKNSLVSL